MITVSVPISVPVSKKKRFYLNLNQYRNAHHHTLSRAKINFHEIVAPTIKHLPKFKTVNLIYTLFTGTEQLCDTPNICSIVDKFFSDVLVSCKVIEDDNRKIVLSVHFCWGGVDKFDPRVEVTIVPGENSPGKPATDHNPEEIKMQITIPQAEIEQAIEAHVREQVVVREDQEVVIDLRATRGPEGYQAIIDIRRKDEAPASPGRKKAGSSAPSPAPAKAKSTVAKDTVVVAKTAKVEKVAEPKAEAEPVAEVEAKVEEELTPAATEPETLAEKVQSEGDEAEAATEATEEVEEDTVPTPAPRQSLFGGLKPPVNA